MFPGISCSISGGPLAGISQSAAVASLVSGVELEITT